jgi:superfamily I DNA/RNA helicase
VAVQNLLILALNTRDAVAMHNALAAGLSRSQQKNIADAMRTLREIAPDHGVDLLRAARLYVQNRAGSTVITRRMEFIIDTVPILQAAMAQNGSGMEDLIRLAYAQFQENALSNSPPQPTADLQRFFDIADRIADAATPLSEQFLKLFDLLSDASDPFQRSSLTVGSVGSYRAITLCPIQMAQGFQWRVVFLLDCVDEKMPGPAADGDEDVLHGAQRRFYVAVTRAMDLLYVCCPLVDDNCARQTPSRFIAALEPVLEDIGAL